MEWVKYTFYNLASPGLGLVFLMLMKSWQNLTSTAFGFTFSILFLKQVWDRSMDFVFKESHWFSLRGMPNAIKVNNDRVYCTLQLESHWNFSNLAGFKPETWWLAPLSVTNQAGIKGPLKSVTRRMKLNPNTVCNKSSNSESEPMKPGSAMLF